MTGYQNFNFSSLLKMFLLFLFKKKKIITIFRY